MNCPWCEREMQAGEIVGDCRSGVRFQPEGEKYAFWDLLGGVGKLGAVRYKWAVFHLPAHYCRHCGRMVIETDVAR